MKISALLKTCLLLCLACGNSDQQDVPEENMDFDLLGNMLHDGDVRTYRVHLPPNHYSSPCKRLMVLAFHGGGGSAEQFESITNLNALSDEEGFIVIYPDGNDIDDAGTRTWNAGDCCGANSEPVLGTDDVGFVSELIDKLIIDHNVDRGRIYATGQSNGGMLTYRLACELGGKIAAFAPSSCTSFYTGPCEMTDVPIVHIHSELDDVAPFEGGQSSQNDIIFSPVEDHLGIVAELNNCNASKTLEFENELYSIFELGNCRGARVLLYLTKDGGHSWAGASAGFDPPSRAFSANRVIWDFFEQFGQ